MANNYGNGKATETKKVKTEIMFQVGIGGDIEEQEQGKDILKTL